VTQKPRYSRAPSVEGEADGCEALFVSVTDGCEIVTDKLNSREVH